MPILFLFFILSVQQIYASQCICCPKVSCIPVDISLTISTNNSKSGITMEDLEMSTNWMKDTESRLKKIKSIKDDILTKDTKIQNLDESMIIQKFESIYLSEMIKIDSNKDKLLIKLLNLEKKIDLLGFDK